MSEINAPLVLQALVAFGCALAAGLLFAFIGGCIRDRMAARRAAAAAQQPSGRS